MRAVKSRDTSAELMVRSVCREMGERGYRLHRRDLPGTPDLAFIGRKLAVFVHGCFWHGHECPAGAKTPKTNAEYWEKKIGRNRIRDADNIRALALMGWRTLIIWECEVKNRGIATQKLRRFLRLR